MTRRARCTGCLHLLAAAGGRTVVVVVPGRSSALRICLWGRFWAAVAAAVEAVVREDWRDQ